MAQNRTYVRNETKEITAWQKRAMDAGISLRALAKHIGCSYRYTVAYFTGFVNPHPARIKAICEYFNVDIAQGAKDFEEAFEAWGKAHADTHVKYGNTYKPINAVDPAYKPRARRRKNADIIEVPAPQVKPQVKPQVEPKRKHTVNFWVHKITGKGMTVREVSTLLKKPYSTTTAYFTGFCMPDKDVIVALCKVFNVDYDRAVAEFTKINEAWGVAHPDYEKSGTSYKLKPKKTAVEVIEEKAATVPVKECKSMDVMHCLKLIYDKVSFDEFAQAMELKTSYTDFIRYIYGKVDFDTWNAIYIG